MNERSETIMQRESEIFAPGVRRWPLVLARGQGSRLWDADGVEYIDLMSGWGVTAIGHGHPALIEAVSDQARTLMQTTNAVYSEPQLDLAERLARIAPPGVHRSFFVASGAEANEGALKLAHRATERTEYVSTLNSFHGRTLGARGVLGQEKYRERWSGIIREASFVPYGDLEAAKSALSERVAAMIVEPIQGEGGVIVPPEDYLSGLAEACHAVGALLIADEIQTCMGRTGRWLACEHSGARPDIVTLGKGLGGGVPIAAFMATDEVMSKIIPGDHGGTYAGNLLCCRAGAAVLQVIEEDGLVERSARLGEHVKSRLEALAKKVPERVECVRGLGLLVGLVLRDPEFAAQIHSLTREHGIIVNLTADRVIRIFPALNIPEDDLDRALDVLESLVANE